MPQAFKNPKWLVGEFQKSGEFDRLRKQLQTHFLNSDEVHSLMARVEEIAREKLSSDVHLEHKTREAIYSEMSLDMERYPIVERAVSNLAVDKDKALLASIDQYLRTIVRGESNDNTKLWSAQPSGSGKRVDDNDNDDSSDYSEDDMPGDDELQLIITKLGEGEDALSTRRNEDITPSNDAAHLPALNENTSGDATPSPLHQRLPDAGSQPALSSSRNENDVESQCSASTVSQAQALPDVFLAGGPSTKTCVGDPVLNEGVAGGPSSQAAEEEEQAGTVQTERGHSFRDVSHLQTQADANDNSYNAEVQAPVAPPFSQHMGQRNVALAAGGAGLYTLSDLVHDTSDVLPETPTAVAPRPT